MRSKPGSGFTAALKAPRPVTDAARLEVEARHAGIAAPFDRDQPAAFRELRKKRVRQFPDAAFEQMITS